MIQYCKTYTKKYNFALSHTISYVVVFVCDFVFLLLSASGSSFMLDCLCLFLCFFVSLSVVGHVPSWIHGDKACFHSSPPPAD